MRLLIEAVWSGVYLSMLWIAGGGGGGSQVREIR
jgi:hypothetical protein